MGAGALYVFGVLIATQVMLVATHAVTEARARSKQKLAHARLLREIRILLDEERWDEALLRLDFLPVDVPTAIKFACENDRAWCLLQARDVSAGLELSEKLAAQSKSDPEAIASCQATRAIGLLMVGRTDEASAQLEQLVSASATKRERAIRWFYLGEARRALGRTDAYEAYRCACDAEPGGPWAKRAEQHLVGRGAYR